MRRFILKNHIKDVRQRHTLKFKKEVYLRGDFKTLWDKIKQRTRYRVSFDTEKLVKCAAKHISGIEKIKPARIAMTRVDVDITYAGVDVDRKLEEKSREVGDVKVLPDLLVYLQKETGLTRHALMKILRCSDRLGEFRVNPQQFMSLTAREILRALHELMLDGIRYEKIAGHCWKMSRIEHEAKDGIVRYLDSLYKVQKQEKCPFDMVEYDSEVERKFAQDLDNNEYVRLFIKLPGWFKINTPIGSYNPDWAFVTDRDEKLYFVQETKSALDKEELRPKEYKKTEYGKHHFKEIDAKYDVVTTLAEVDF